jgi:uncharacterized protein YjbJ (UPF0337 family)
MDNLRLKGEWNEVKGRIKQIYGDLTDDDLIYVEGQHDDISDVCRAGLVNPEKRFAA